VAICQVTLNTCCCCAVCYLVDAGVRDGIIVA